FAALGTSVARRIQALRQPLCKVIVVDCDETLWNGVCGEVGPRGVEIDSGRRRLQEFLIEQSRLGTLICVASKNNEDDVEAVFDGQQMPLTREHIAAWRVNWRPKPENLRELSEELHLGLDSFVFVDDNPIE